jgi:3-methyladenine DNA glycosylase AlkC
MTLLKEMTKRSSSEFGIRFLLIEDPERALSTMEKWTCDPSHHVRRLVSEGTRPRLPWAMRLPVFIEDPAPLLPLLESLRDDGSEYVRRSVANNLNDIAKDHPDVVAKVARKWLRKAGKDRERLVRHACRTLVKQGHKETLAALGYRPPEVNLESLRILTPTVSFGDALLFEVTLSSTSERSQPLIIDYAVHHRKANGATTPKVFKWKTITLAEKTSHTAKRKHGMRKITTRRYHPGEHRLEIIINGVSFGSWGFELEM